MGSEPPCLPCDRKPNNRQWRPWLGNGWSYCHCGNSGAHTQRLGASICTVDFTGRKGSSVSNLCTHTQWSLEITEAALLILPPLRVGSQANIQADLREVPRCSKESNEEFLHSLQKSLSLCLPPHPASFHIYRCKNRKMFTSKRRPWSTAICTCWDRTLVPSFSGSHTGLLGFT